MAPIRSSAEAPVTQSLLDRLTDTDDWPTTRAASLRMYREGIRRDIEWLLNTRRSHIAELRGLPLASRSVLQFGLDDVTEYSSVRGNPELLLADLAEALRAFEPRIVDMRIVLERSDEFSRDIRFRVEGRLRYSQGSEEIRFDTVLGAVSGAFDVR